MANGNRTKNKKVVKYRRRRHINIGMIVFAVVFLYVSIYMVVYLTRDKVTIYEVVMGKNASITNKSYTGLILRDEHIVTTDTSGYLNYFVREGERVSLSSTVYTVDESGTINSILANASENGEIVISDDDELELRNLISEYTAGHSDMDFSMIYDFKQEMEAKILECINLNSIKQLLEGAGASAGGGGMQFKINKAAMTGIVEYYTDGYEEKTEGNLTEADFNTENYSKTQHMSGDLIAAGSPVYKVINTEDWSIYIELSEEDVENYRQTGSIRIKVLSDGRELSGDFSIVYISGQAYGKIGLIRYMSRYASERFLELQIIEEQEEGLKIPKTSVVEKDFFTIPVSFAGHGGDSTDTGFFKRVYDEAGNESIVFITPVIYHSTEEYYYIDTGDELAEGDFVVMADSSDAYRVGPKESLQGVYNVNNGYCIFRKIDILTETGEYYLVDTETSYGLKVFDHIVIDGSMVNENQVVFSVN